MQHDFPAPHAPSLSVLITGSASSEGRRLLLERLRGQTAASDAFEVILVLDDLDGPLRELAARMPCACTLVQRPGATTPQARNVALSLAGAPLALFLEDDCFPDPDLVERHLAAHADAGPRTAVLGWTPFTESAMARPLVRMLDASSVLRPVGALEHDAEVGWTMFRAANLSVETRALIEAGGFDERHFDVLGGDDVELGLRLADRGMRVVFRRDCVAHSDRTTDTATFVARAFDAGRAVARMNHLHGDRVPCWPSDVAERTDLEDSIVGSIEERLAGVEELITSLEAIEEQFLGEPLSAEELETAGERLVELAELYRLAGMHRERTGVDLFGAIASGAPSGATVSVIVVSRDALDMTRRCVEALREGVDPRYGQEIIVVDNGSTDGSAEWLESQSDLTVIRNATNHGAPRARNQGLRHASGDWVAFLDNDVVVPRGWLDRALYHGVVDPRVGSVALCANRASKSQVLEYAGPDDKASIDAFAADHFESTGRRGKDTMLFTSLAVLVSRSVLERIGGFDEAFSPWGFEDDDLALRIHLAGWRNRVALDSFVYHAPYPTMEKVERHTAWLESNWHAFVDKWSPAARGSGLFDYAGLRVPSRHTVTEAQLVFELPPEGAAPPAWEGAETVAASESGATAEPSAPTGAERANVVILGCGRSGTSMVSGMLAEAGWYVGDDPYPPRDANAKGFFETPEINGINEALLSGSVPNEPPLRRMQHWLALAPEPVHFEVDPALSARMERLTARGPFAFKDPRFCYTLPAWRPALGEARFVCVFREPAASAASIVKECETEAYLQGAGVDFDRAVEIWNAMYRQVLDGHAGEGEWLFLHFDQLMTPEGVARLEAFVGAPVAADFPEARLKRSSSARRVPAAVAATFRELCERAEAGSIPIAAEPAPERPLVVAEPELTVLICSYQRRDTLLRCLRSFEEQTAAGRYEIVVVNDGSDDGTREALEAWTPRAPVRVLHRENGGLAAARNTGLAVARGRYVLLVNDDTIAAPELVERHLEAHAKHGPNSMILGSFVQPRAALDNALMRVLERTNMVFCFVGLETDTPYDWNRFWTCNVSVSLDAVREVGSFDESFRHYGCEDTDLGYRLCRRFGMKLYHEPSARAEHEHVLDFDDVRRRTRTVAAAHVRLFRTHPEILDHPIWSRRRTRTLAAGERLVIQTLPDRARAEAFVRELSRIDVGALERTGETGAKVAELLCNQLQQTLAELHGLWWSEGECDGMRTFGLDRLGDLCAEASEPASPPTPFHPSTQATQAAQIARVAALVGAMTAQAGS